MAVDRQAAKAALLARTQESANKADDSGRFMSYLNPELMLKSFRPHAGEGGNLISIVPFVIGNQYPSRTYPNLRPGDLTYVLDLFIHGKVGVNDDSYVCPNRNYGQRCPICENAQEVRDQIPDEIFEQQNPESDPQYGHLVKLYNKLKPRRRCVYNILDWTNDANPDALTTGMRYWEVSHYLFEKNLVASAKLPRGGGYVAFSDLDEGKDIFFTVEGKGLSTKYMGIRFEDRPEPISVEHEEQAVSLDDYLMIPTYAQLYEAHYGEAYEEGNPPPSPAVTPPPATRGGGRSRGTAQQAPPAEDEDIPSNAAAASTPPAGTGRRRGAAATTTATTQPATRAAATTRPATPAGTCPAGHVFGTDVDAFEADCNTCVCWDDCARANAEQAAAASAPTPPPATQAATTTRGGARRGAPAAATTQPTTTPARRGRR